MKNRMFAAFMTFAMIAAVPVCASAQEGNYLDSLPQYSYIRQITIPTEDYADVCLSTGSAGRYIQFEDETPLFLMFKGPDGALASSFRYDEAEFLDEAQSIQYHYHISGSDSYEEFLNKSASDDYILLDGTDGTAAYIDPDRRVAYGMISTEQFGKSSKLRIMIGLDYLDSKMPTDTITSALSDAILSEVKRVHDEMHYQTIAPFWSIGKYCGAKLLDSDFNKKFILTFPDKLNLHGDEATYAVTSVQIDEVEATIPLSDHADVEFTASFEDYSYPASHKEDAPDEVKTVVLDNGNEWELYVSNVTSEGNLPYAWYASRKTDYTDEYSPDRPYYINLYFSADQFRWSGEDELIAFLTEFDNNIQLVNAEDDPYVAPEASQNDANVPATESTSTTETETSASSDVSLETSAVNAVSGIPATGNDNTGDASWTCPDCSTVNEGNFCSNCGAKKPLPAEWTCPDCSTVNEGNFCSNCGAKRPE